MSAITVNGNSIIIDNGRSKHRAIRGTIEIPLAAVSRVTVDETIVRIHVPGIVHPRPRYLEGDQHNRYAVMYMSETKAKKVAAELDWALRSLPSTIAPEGWQAPPQGEKALKSAQKHGTYEDWERDQERAEAFKALSPEEQNRVAVERIRQENPEQADRIAARLEVEKDKRENAEKLAPKWWESGISSFGDITVNGNGTVKFNGLYYDIRGARAAIDAGMANNKRFGKGRLVMGAAAAPLIGIFAAPALIRKQKGFITLEVELADGTILSTLGQSKGRGVADAQKVLQDITRQAGNVTRNEYPGEPSEGVHGDSDALTVRLEKLHELHLQGVITDDEFSKAKATLLSSM